MRKTPFVNLAKGLNILLEKNFVFVTHLTHKANSIASITDFVLNRVSGDIFVAKS